MVDLGDRIKAAKPSFKVGDAEYQEIVKFAGTGFALLTGLLTFFGIKDGYLDRIVRTSPLETLAIVFVVGLGTVLSLFSPALEPTKQSKGWIITLLSGVVVAISGAPLLGGILTRDSEARQLVIVVAVTVVILAITAKVVEFTIPQPLACLLIAVVAISSGVFDAAKLSVIDKLRTASPTITTALGTTSGQRSVEVSIKGSDFDNPVRVRVVTTGSDGSTHIQGEQLFNPNREGTLDAKATFPVSSGAWSSILIVSCQESPRADDPDPKNVANTPAPAPSGMSSGNARSGANSSVAAAAGPQDSSCTPQHVESSYTISVDAPRLDAHWSLDTTGRAATYTARVEELRFGQHVFISIGQEGQQPAFTSTRIDADKDGTVMLSGTLAVKPSQNWSITLAVCPAETKESCPTSLVARLAVPAE